MTSQRCPHLPTDPGNLAPAYCPFCQPHWVDRGLRLLTPEEVYAKYPGQRAFVEVTEAGETAQRKAMAKSRTVAKIGLAANVFGMIAWIGVLLLVLLVIYVFAH